MTEVQAEDREKEKVKEDSSYSGQSHHLSNTVRKLKTETMDRQIHHHTPILLINSCGQKLKWWFPENTTLESAPHASTNKLRSGEATPLSLQRTSIQAPPRNAASAKHASRASQRNICLLLYSDPSLCFPVTLPLHKVTPSAASFFPHSSFLLPLSSFLPLSSIAFRLSSFLFPLLSSIFAHHTAVQN